MKGSDTLRKFVFYIIGHLMVLSSYAFATDVSGDIWGIWTADNSPYNVIGSVRVPPDSSLVIEAGVEVIFCASCTLLVDSNAVFIAEGSILDTIEFSGGKGLRFCRNNDISYLEYCHLHGIHGDTFGALKVDSSSLLISNSLIDHCSAIEYGTGFGGGIAARWSSLTLQKSKISYNYCSSDFYPWATAFGAGVYLYFADGYISGTIFDNNNAEGGLGIAAGAGICLYNADAELYNCTITKNNAHYVAPYSPYDDRYFGSGIAGFYSSHMLLTNSIVYGNNVSQIELDSITVTYSDIGDTIPGDGNIYSDPMFVDSVGNDFHLLFGSPCINTGDPDSPLDPDSTRADMGALFYDFRTDIDEPLPLPEQFILHQNYPNPFNATTNISYHLPKASNVSIDIFDVTGRQVSSLFTGYQAAGSYSIIWDADRQVSGVYFYRLKASDISAIQRCVLIK